MPYFESGYVEVDYDTIEESGQTFQNVTTFNYDVSNLFVNGILDVNYNINGYINAILNIVYNISGELVEIERVHTFHYNCGEFVNAVLTSHYDVELYSDRWVNSPMTFFYNVGEISTDSHIVVVRKNDGD